MVLIRTPEARFADLPNYPYEPSYVRMDGGERMAYVEAGEGTETFLCLHGVPTWGYLYRTMIPTLADRGRVVVPDLPGHGRSDTYTEMDEYSFGMLHDWLTAFVAALDLRDVTLVCQDWGGILGLCTVHATPERFARLVLMNFGAFSRLEAIRSGDDPPDSLGPFGEWQQYCRETPDLPVADVIERGPSLGRGHVSTLEPAVRAGYEAPFPDAQSKAGARALPQLVPTDPGMEGADLMLATLDTIGSWDRPAFVLFSDGDPITRGGREFFRSYVPTASEQPDVWIRDAGHYLQEDAGPRVADHVVRFVDRTPLD